MNHSPNYLLSAIFAGLAFIAASLPATAQGVYTPSRGSDERVRILNGVRPAVENVMQTPVEFIVRTMNVYQGWAFVALDPRHPGGGSIDPRRTALANEMDMHDGLTTYALLRNQGGAWQAVDMVVGPTDVAWDAWPAQHGAPAALFR